MITHCPSCHTHFRVRAEQLAARSGYVRCGKCSRIFHALDHRIEEIVPAAAPRAAPKLEASHADTAAADQRPGTSITPAVGIGAAAGEPTSPTGAGVPAETIETAATTPEIALPTPAKPNTEAAPGASAFDFGPGGAAASAKAVRRWPWLLGALLLLLTLFAQTAYYYRSAIIVLFPEVKPYATALCASLGCDLPLPRRIDMMSIEASDLQADTTNPSVMVLSATIKNRAVFNQQHPLLELTLTDAQEQPVVRRVLAPRDYLGKAVNAQAGLAANTEIAVKVYIEGSQVKATGYRLYLFYP